MNAARKDTHDHTNRTRRTGLGPLASAALVIAAASCLTLDDSQTDSSGDSIDSAQGPLQSQICPQPSFTVPGFCGLAGGEALALCDELCKQGDAELPPHPACTVDPASLRCADNGDRLDPQASYRCECFIPEEWDPTPPPPEGGAGGTGGAGGGNAGGPPYGPGPASDPCPPTHSFKSDDPQHPVPFSVEGGGQTFTICCNGATNVTPTECCCRVPKGLTPAQEEAFRNQCDQQSGYPDCHMTS